MTIEATHGMQPVARVKPLTAARQARQDAKAYGARTYQGQDCQAGHGGLRYTSNAQCITCANAQRVAQGERIKAQRLALGLPVRNRRSSDAIGSDILADL